MYPLGKSKNTIKIASCTAFVSIEEVHIFGLHVQTRKSTQIYVINGIIQENTLEKRHTWHMHSIDKITGTIKTARKHNRLTQAELAKRAGISLRTYQRLEASDGAARIDSLFRVLDALGLDIATVEKTRPSLDDLEALYEDE